MLIPKGITGISEKNRATLQAWIELVDWTGLGVLPKSQVPRKLKLNMDPMSQMHQWLTKKELQHGIKDHETAQLFVDNRIELKRLADDIRNQDPNAESRVESMSEGEVLGTALIVWIREAEDEIGVARKVVEVVWPRTCAGRAQIHTKWAICCETKLDLIKEIESLVRKHSARCERHLIKLGYYCPGCQHGLCTACNQIEGHLQCPWCLEPFHYNNAPRASTTGTQPHAYDTMSQPPCPG